MNEEANSVEVENLSEKRPVRSLTCTADGYEYQITSDDRNLYFHKLGREGVGSEGHKLGTTRVVKAEVEAVRCMRVRGKTVILVVFEGKTSRLVVKGNVKEELLMRLFGGVPLKLSINAHSTVLTDRYELRLLSASFLITLVYVLSLFMKELRFLTPFVGLGWVVIPFFWLIPCAGRMHKGSLRDQFPMGGGMIAAIYSCLMLWFISFSYVERWSALLVPSLVIAVVTCVIYRISRGSMDAKALAALFLMSLVLYAPAASMSLNSLLPVWRDEARTVQIVTLNERDQYGEHMCSMTVEENGAKKTYRISEEEFASLQEGDTVQIHHKIGLLGIPFRDIDFE